MNPAPAKVASETTTAPPVFSYAQAAKGRVIATAASDVQSHQSNTSGVNTPAKDTNSQFNTPSVGSDRGDRSVNGASEAESRIDYTTESIIVGLKESTLDFTESSPAAPHASLEVIETSQREDTDDKDDDFILVGHPGPDSLRDRSSRGGAVPVDKHLDLVDGRKSKKARKQKNMEKEAEKEKEESKPEILVPAPLPVVNFWQRRSEEFAKARPAPMTTSSTPTLHETPNMSDPVPPQALQSIDLRRRGRPASGDDSGSLIALTQNGGSHSYGRPQKKGIDGQTKAKDDHSIRKSGIKGHRTAEKEEKPVANRMPPPVEDAISWPTPETALEEEKRKNLEKLDKEEKDESVQNKPRPKEKWVTVPYIPTVTFNTPIPPRGGRGRGGARSGRTEPGGRPTYTHTGPSIDKVSSNNTNAPLSDSADMPEPHESPRATSLPPAKRSSTDQSSARRGPIAHRGDGGKPAPAHGGTSTFSQGASQSASNSIDAQDVHLARNGSISTSRGSYSQNTPGESYNLKSNTDRRNDPNFRITEQVKDVPGSNKDAYIQARERGDNRADRIRGGFRGRGGHPSFQNGQTHPPSAFSNGQPATPNGFPIRHNSNPYSPPLQQNTYNNPYAPTRAGRGGSRSQSIPTNGLYARYALNGAAGTPHITPLQTANPVFDYTPQGMNANLYQNYIDQASVLAMVTMQLEYYFSIDNLCKDVFLRKHMDSQGFVFLSFIAGFKRIQALSQDFELLRYACQESAVLELIRGEDGFDRLRRKEGWEKWVLPLDERDESVRNHGPSFYERPLPLRNGNGQMLAAAHHSMSPLAFSPTNTDQQYRLYANGLQPVLNGYDSNSHADIPLSAAVPDFSPAPAASETLADPLEIETTFHDDEVAHLTLVFNEPVIISKSRAPTRPSHSASTRTFSNGSIDSRSLTEEAYEEARQGRSLANGSHGSEASTEECSLSKSSFDPLSRTKTSPTVMWVKGQNKLLNSEFISQEPYIDFRAKALHHRETSNSVATHPDMQLLYEFWSHFLCRNFNAAMYTDFRRYAMEDARNKSFTGLNNLTSYYDEILNSPKKVIPEELARHYVDLAKEDPSDERPVMTRLRASWRNGALDMKSRKRIDNYLDAQLREDLERVPRHTPNKS